MNFKDFLILSFICISLIIAIDYCTSELDIISFSWDFAYYIAMAEHGFSTKPLVSPFVYRYPTPLIARMLSSQFGLSTAMAFKAIAYVGAFLQLSSVFAFVQYITKSQKSAYLAMLVTVLSLSNIKFLQFDVYRPDHLAYALIVLNVYLIVKQRFYLLLIATTISVQFREFALVPLLAYWLTLVMEQKWQIIIRYFFPFAICIIIAVILPRTLIPITANGQYVNLSDGLRAILSVLLNIKRDINVVFCLLAYMLPTLMLLTMSRLRLLMANSAKEMQYLCLTYSLLVILLSIYGGADITRFVSYLFLPQALLIGFLSEQSTKLELYFMLFATFLFNKIAVYEPPKELNGYLDFYGGYDDRVNWTTGWRLLEMFVFLFISVLIRRYSYSHTINMKTNTI